MIEFVLRARKAPTDPSRFLGQAGADAHVEYLPQVLINSLFVSKGHRRDVRVSFVLEGSADYSRVITFDGATLGTIDDQSHTGLLSLFAECLRRSAGQTKAGTIQVLPGLTVSSLSFEALIKDYQQSRAIFLLDKKGVDVRNMPLSDNAVFVLTDHIPMPVKQAKSLVNRGATKVSLGPKMLHASQCVVLIQNEYDRAD